MSLKYADDIERVRARYFRSTAVSARPFDVYIDPGHAGLLVRWVIPDREPRKLPPTAVLIGRYKRPHPAALFLDDLRAVVAAMELGQ